MNFKSVEDMNNKYTNENRRKLTCEELKWIEKLKYDIDTGLNEIYNNKPYINYLSVYSDTIPRTAIQGSGSDKFFNEIKYLEIELRDLGYKVSSEFSYNHGLADAYALYLSWKIK